MNQPWQLIEVFFQVHSVSEKSLVQLHCHNIWFDNGSRVWINEAQMILMPPVGSINCKPKECKSTMV